MYQNYQQQQQQQLMQHPLVFIHYLKSLKPSLQPVREIKYAVGQIICTEKGILVVEQNKYVMPPSHQRYVAWGYTDESIRIGHVDYERSYVTFENVQEGTIFACCSPDSRSVITAGASCVVNVWELGKAAKMRRMQLKARLYAHTDAVTCMAVSSHYHMLVTGSRDHSCIIWDINRWAYVRQLPNHYGAVSSICINELTGDIATASGTYLYLWNINGDLLASINTITSSRNHLVLCICMSHVNEWDNNNVILTGGTDGIVRMWSLNYTQVKISDSTVQSPRSDATTTSKDKHLSLSSPLVLQERTDSEAKFFPHNFTAAASSTTTTTTTPTQQQQQQISDMSTSTAASMSQSMHKSSMFSSMQSESGLASPVMPPPSQYPNQQQQQQKPLFYNPSSNTSESEDTGGGGGERTNLSSAVVTTSTKEPTLDLEDFVFIENSQVALAAATPTATLDKYEYMSSLRPGFKWKRELIFKSKLTMHTSYDRKDNSEPASVTAIAISRDHKTIYVGDSRGRVFTWVCTEQPGRNRADHWVRDETAEQCKQCHLKFSFSERRHHCRDCGGVFCNACTKYEVEIPRLHINKPVRVCHQCFISNSRVDALSSGVESTAADISSSTTNTLTSS